MKLVNQDKKYWQFALLLALLCTIAFIYDKEVWQLFAPLIPALLVAHVSFKEHQRQLQSDAAKSERLKIESEIFKLNKLVVLIHDLVSDLMIMKQNYIESVLERGIDYRRSLDVPYMVCLPEDRAITNDVAVDTSFLLRFIPAVELKESIVTMNEPYKYFHPANISSAIAFYNRVVFLWHRRNKLYEDSIALTMTEATKGGKVALHISNNRQANDIMNYLLIGEECIMHTDSLLKCLCNISNALIKEVAPHYKDFAVAPMIKIPFELKDEGWLEPLSKEEHLRIIKIPEQGQNHNATD